MGRVSVASSIPNIKTTFAAARDRKLWTGSVSLLEYQTTTNKDNNATLDWWKRRGSMPRDENTKKAHSWTKVGKISRGFWDVQPRELRSTGSDFHTKPGLENDHNISSGDNGFQYQTNLF